MTHGLVAVALALLTAVYAFVIKTSCARVGPPERRPSPQAAPEPEDAREDQMDDETGDAADDDDEIDQEIEPAAVQLLFATHADGDLLVLDCVSESDGWPFAVHVEWAPSMEYAGLFVDSILQRWTDSGADLAMRVVEGPDGPEVSISGPDSRIRLPLAA